MIAAENGALPRGKVGGMGDVMLHLPSTLAERGWEVSVLTPAYGMFAALPGAVKRSELAVRFGGRVESVGLYEVPGSTAAVRHQVLDHALFSPQGPGRIYCDDGPDRPFYSDAGKFAFFSAAAAQLLAEAAKPPQIVHLHDWHTGLFFALRRFDSRFRSLQRVRAVYTIHNLAFQGRRPLHQTASSFDAWFPQLRYKKQLIADPSYADCVNPVATAIRLADKVHTVSPTYAREIQQPSAPQAGFIGGEGLEAELRAAAAAGRFVGVLNGCPYPDAPARRRSWPKLLESLRAELPSWVARSGAVRSAHYLADRRLAELPAKRPGTLLTSVGRLADQKVKLFSEPVDGARSALEAILDALGNRGMLVMLGSGDPLYEQFFCEVMARYRNFLFLRGYSDEIAGNLYAAGDLFLMPSSFEPCGISQMLAMRAGQPCVVHAVGGLKDTVDADCGFVFDGSVPQRQARHFVAEVERALKLQRAEGGGWKKIKRAAAAKRFTWEAAARRYERELYAGAG